MLTFDVFYKNYGIRKPGNFVVPKTFPILDFELPRDSAYHFAPQDPVAIGPNATEAFLAVYNKKLPVEHVTALTSMQGIVRKTTVQPSVLMRDFQQGNKKFRRVDEKTEEAVGDTIPLIYNYAMLDELYRYSPNVLNPYYTWYNTQKTIWDTIRSEAKTSTRHHFVFIEVPLVVPSLSNLKTFAEKRNSSFLKVFDTPAKMMALELWKWISPQWSASTVIGDFSNKDASKVCLVFTYEGRWCALSLNYLKSWVKGNLNDTHLNVQQFKPEQLQKFFLKMMDSIQNNLADTDEALAMVDGIDPLIEKIGDDSTTQTEQMTPASQVPEAIQSDTMSGDEVIPGEDTPDEVQVETAKTSRSEHEADVIDEAEIDKDLEAMANIEKNVLASKYKPGTTSDDEEMGVDEPKLTSAQVTELIFAERDTGTVLDSYLAKVSEGGSVSASEYRTLSKAIQNTENLKCPYAPNQTLTEFSVVKPEDIAIPRQENILPDSETIQDKSMLQSTLKTFNSAYVTQLMPKHVASMVNAVKAAGVIVQDYKVEKDGDILGEYEMHTLTLRPVEGVSSTIRFKMPVVDHNGVFSANSNKYRLRMLRGDRPIRKIGPTRVGLTSYYGKVSVTRADKKISDEAFWLSKKINLMGQDVESGVRDVIPSDMFDGSQDNPTVYSGLSKYFKSFTIDGNLFTFSKVEQIKLFGEEQLIQLRRQGLVVTGRTKEGHAIVIDKHNVIAAINGSDIQTMGTIYTLLGLKQNDAPVEYSSLKVYSKFIPVGVILGFILGFDNLMTFLKVQPRTVEGRGQLKLAPTEWAIRFKDLSLVFDRKDKIATMILAGFAGYHKTVAQYHYESFNNENVYLNLLTENGIGVRYLRELKLLDEMFVDPITKSVLEIMKEPTTFRGLLVRATELLVTDKCPDNQDTLQSRFKGYERFAGAVYGELVNSIRDFKSRNIRGKSRIEMSPYAVWKTITTDPANMPANEINPIESLKQIEAVTYAGNGGRAKDTMNKASRAFHENDIGITSEATSDSSDVGINMYLSPNAQFDDLLGMVSKTDITKAPNSSLVSTSALLAPGADHDDGKRVKDCTDVK